MEMYEIMTGALNLKLRMQMHKFIIVVWPGCNFIQGSQFVHTMVVVTSSATVVHNCYICSASAITFSCVAISCMSVSTNLIWVGFAIANPCLSCQGQPREKNV